MIEMNSETDFVATNERFLDGSNKVVNALLTSGVESLEDALKLEVDGETVELILTSLTATIGEKITLRRVASFSLEGKVAQAYKHANGRIGTIIVGEGVEETTLRDIAMHAAAMSPEFLSRDEISSEKIEKETQLAKEELADTLAGKPEEIQANIIKGKVDKTLAESVLLEQAFVKDSSKKIKDIIGSGKLVSYVRYEVGEGIEKAENNFAEEVAAQTAAALNN
jgi:elongation factor Ts